jgi:hypothetical protein
MRGVLSIFLAIALEFGAGSPTGGEALPPAKHFDPKEGVIDGKVAIGIWPSTSPGSGKAADPAGFQVLLMSPWDNPVSEIAYPAGSWFQPPTGVYRYLLEGTGYIAPHFGVISFEPQEADGKGMAILAPVIPSGMVTLSREGPYVREGLQLRLLRLENTYQGRLVQELSRHVSAPKAAEVGLAMPAGKVMAGIWDADERGYRALAPVVDVPAHGSVEASPRSPEEGKAGFVGVFERPNTLANPEEDDVVVRLVSPDGRSYEPDAVARTSFRVYGIWFSVPAAVARIELQSMKASLPAADVRLRSGRIERDEYQLQALPQLSVTLELPPILDELPRTLVVTDLIDGDESERQLAPGETETVFEAVPAGPLEVIATFGNWELAQRIDMSDGADGSVHLAAQALSIHGTVLYGDEPHPATIDFLTGKIADPLHVETDDEGDYEVLLVMPAAYGIGVTLAGRSLPFWMNREIDRDGRVDLRLPANDFRFRVKDSTSGEPISGAEIVMDNRTEDGITSSLLAVTDDEGWAFAHPMRAGELEYSARAKGYRPAVFSEETVPVAEEELSRTIEILLEPEGDKRTIAVRLASGQPASGAELMVPSAGGAPPWTGVAGPNGEVSIPSSLAGSQVLVRHSAAGSAARLWSGSSEGWVLDPPAPPLRVKAVLTNGDPAPWSGVVVWVNGVRLTGGGLSWLAGGRVSTDREGVWVWSNPPATPLAMLLFRPDKELLTLSKTGALDQLRSEVPYPWPPTVEIEVVQ